MRTKGSFAAACVVALVLVLRLVLGGGEGPSGPAADAPAAAPLAAPAVAVRSSPEQRFRVSAARRAHILDGDRTGGGHGPGRATPSKSMFPDSMTDDQVVAEILRIANDPASYDARSLPSGTGRTEAFGNVRRRDGRSFRVKVVVDVRTGDVVTAYPLEDQRGR